MCINYCCYTFLSIAHLVRRELSLLTSSAGFNRVRCCQVLRLYAAEGTAFTNVSDSDLRGSDGEHVREELCHPVPVRSERAEIRQRPVL